MLFSRKRPPGESKTAESIALIRDVVEILAIVAAGVWAFYVFAYENRIKPSFASANVDTTATLQRLSDRGGLIGVGLHLTFHNIGSVKVRFVGVAVNVYGQRVRIKAPSIRPPADQNNYRFGAFFSLGESVPVFAYSYVTRVGSPSSTQETEIDPGGSIDNFRTFYVPKGRFDLLTVGLNVLYTKYEKGPATRMVVLPGGDVTFDTDLSKVEQDNVLPITSLDVR